MDDLLAKERAAHEYVKSLHSHDEVPFKVVLQAFADYRSLAQEVIFAKFSNAEKLETRLWQQHTETRQVLARTLKGLRKMQDRTVEIRVAVEMYLRFIKQSTKFYRSYIYELSQRFGGIPELQTIAFQVKPEASSQQAVTAVGDAQLRRQVLASCHRTLIYLGDLCRYRATDNLDKAQDFGPAIGFYGLACTLRPESGWGHNQQSVVALEQKQNLRVIYHIYRSLNVAEPVHAARKSLKLHFTNINLAWERGDLIDKTTPNDVDTGKKALVGWFIRLHSLYSSGEQIRGFEELERELFSRLKNELLQRSIDSTLIRMVFVNLAAQQTATENYQELQNSQNETSFYLLLRINVIFFTKLLELIHDELVAAAINPLLVDAELSAKIRPMMVKVLPSLRLYSFWLLSNTHLLHGLASVDLLASSIETFWQTYARVLDIIAVVFPIWDLEDLDTPSYMLEEDAEALGFLPLTSAESSIPLLHRTWYHNDILKSRSAVNEAERMSEDDETLARVLGILETGSYVANNIDDTPLEIRGSRFAVGNAELAELPRPPTPPPVEKPKPLSYAAAAAAKRNLAKTAKPSSTLVPSTDADKLPDKTPSRDDPMSRMVDSLVEDEDTDNPKTPPQHFASNPAVMSSVSETDLSLHTAASPKISYIMPVSPQSMSNSPRQNSNTRSGASVVEDLSDFTRPKTQPGSPAMLWTPDAPTRIENSRKKSASPKNALHRRNGSSTSNQSPRQPGFTRNRGSDENTSRPSKRHSESKYANGIVASSALNQSLVNATPQRVLNTPMQASDSNQASPLLFGSDPIWGPFPKQKPRTDLTG